MSDKYTLVGRGKHQRWVKSPEYAAFSNLLQACNNPNDPRYELLGAKHVRVEILFEDLIRDIGYKPSTDHLLARIDSKGNFAVGNLCWITRPQRRKKGTRHKPPKKVVCGHDAKNAAHQLCHKCYQRDLRRHRTKKQRLAGTKYNQDYWKRIKDDPVKHAAVKERQNRAQKDRRDRMKELANAV
jgi:hypothetical protein